MFSNKYSANQKMTFRRFLSADYARDYIYVDEPYEEQIARAAAYIREADYVLIGVGAGMSAAAGAEYGGAFFQEHFAEFIERYGITAICGTCIPPDFILSRTRRAAGGCGAVWRCWLGQIWM